MRKTTGEVREILTALSSEDSWRDLVDGECNTRGCCLPRPCDYHADAMDSIGLDVSATCELVAASEPTEWTEQDLRACIKERE